MASSTSTAIKILLGLLAGFVLLVVVSGVAGYVWLQNNKVRLQQGGMEAMSEGRAFAKDRADRECLEEATRRLQASQGFLEEAKNKLFLEGCLGQATRTQQFCANVTTDPGIMASARWQLKACEDIHMIGDQRCTRMLAAVQAHCRTR